MRIDEARWSTLEQEWPHDSSVRITRTAPTTALDTPPTISAYTPSAAREDALQRASDAANQALDLIGSAVDWLGVVDEKAASHHEKAVAGVSSLADYLTARTR